MAKATALKAIDKALMKVLQAELLAAVKEFAASPVGQSGEFCPHPATWFNGERWTDDPAEWQKTSRNGSRPHV